MYARGNGVCPFTQNLSSYYYYYYLINTIMMMILLLLLILLLFYKITFSLNVIGRLHQACNWIQSRLIQA